MYVDMFVVGHGRHQPQAPWEDHHCWVQSFVESYFPIRITKVVLGYVGSINTSLIILDAFYLWLANSIMRLLKNKDI